ncbi:unnamed protein product [Brugia pahangi]|uniref:Hexosyltransferase n=1 Tax=Brugia pahangi TaxID=6280 RepID=A0A0N4SWZ9_BRUPA|nr:unnamed protein product [Brugia pahangi]
MYPGFPHYVCMGFPVNWMFELLSKFQVLRHPYLRMLLLVNDANFDTSNDLKRKWMNRVSY